MGFLKRLLSIGGKKNHSPTNDLKSKASSSQPTQGKRKSTFNTVAGAPYGTQARSTPALNELQLPQVAEDDCEAAVHRLLRSSSARYAVVNEVDYTNLPPMPHPINAVLEAQQQDDQVKSHLTGTSSLGPFTCPSTTSLCSTTSTRGNATGTYNVTVYRKERLSSGPEEALTSTPKPKKRFSAHLNAVDSPLLKLRAQPSLVSLVSLYDEQGKLPDRVFSDYTDDAQATPGPPKRKPVHREVPMKDSDDEESVPIPAGKPQVKRNGSTLRQLLGASTNETSGYASEGDISWAERFLGELDAGSDTGSTHSSFMIPTPSSANVAFSGDISATTDATQDDAAISSLHVELSETSQVFDEDEINLSFDNHDDSHLDLTIVDMGKKPSCESNLTADNARTPTAHKTSPISFKSSIGPTVPATPQRRASQIFEFIKKRASKHHEKDERDLPEPPVNVPASEAPMTLEELVLNSKRNSTATTSSNEDDRKEELEVGQQLLKSQMSSSSGSCEVTSVAPPSATSSRSKRYTVQTNFTGGSSSTSTSHSPSAFRRSMSERMDSHVEGGLEQMKGMIKRLSFTLGSRRPSDEEVPEPLAPASTSAVLLKTPTRPTSEKEKKEREVKVLMSGPTKVIVTAPTPGTNHTAAPSGYSLRGPRGPRGQHSKRRSGSSREETQTQPDERDHRRSRSERENARVRDDISSRGTDDRSHRRTRSERENGGSVREKSQKEDGKHRSGVTTTSISAPRKKLSMRSTLGSSVASRHAARENEDLYGAVYAEAKRFVEATSHLPARGYDGMAKGSMSLSVKTDLPVTPLRTSRLSVNQSAFFQPPTVRGPKAGTGYPSEEMSREKEKRRSVEKTLYALPSGRTSGRTARVNRV